MLAVVAAFLLLEGSPSASELATLSEAADASNPDAVAALENAVRGYEAMPRELLADPELAGALMEARLVLAWARFDATKEPATQDSRALEGIDEVVRTAAVLGQQPSLKNFEPEFVSLFKDRAAALERGDVGVIQAKCAVSCQLIVDEAPSTNPTNSLPHGRYRVWVVAEANEIEPLQTVIVVDAPTVVVEFGQIDPEPEPEPAPKPKAKRTRAKPAPQPPLDGEPSPLLESPKRLLPVWAEAFGIVAGVGLAGAGATLLAFNGYCRDETCNWIADNKPHGIPLTAVGATAIVAFTAVLVVDTMRAKRGKPERVRVEAGRIRF